MKTKKKKPTEEEMIDLMSDMETRGLLRVVLVIAEEKQVLPTNLRHKANITLGNLDLLEEVGWIDTSTGYCELTPKAAHLVRYVTGFKEALLRGEKRRVRAINRVDRLEANRAKLLGETPK